MGAIDLTHIYKKYKGFWVALDQDEQTVLSSGKNAKKVYEQALAKGFKKPILIKIPKEVVPYIGYLEN